MAKSIKQIAGEATIHYVPPRAKRQRPKPKLQPPLTPMIDVTFQLILFFILSTEFRANEGMIPGTLPQTGGVAAASNVRLDPIEISVRASGESAVYEMSGADVGITSPEELYGYLKARQNALGTAEVPVVIKPQPDVAWEFVVEAFNQALRARFKNIGFAAA